MVTLNGPNGSDQQNGFHYYTWEKHIKSLRLLTIPDPDIAEEVWGFIDKQVQSIRPTNDLLGSTWHNRLQVENEKTALWRFMVIVELVSFRKYSAIVPDDFPGDHEHAHPHKYVAQPHEDARKVALSAADDMTCPYHLAVFFFIGRLRPTLEAYGVWGTFQGIISLFYCVAHCAESRYTIVSDHANALTFHNVGTAQKGNEAAGLLGSQAARIFYGRNATEDQRNRGARYLRWLIAA